MSFLCTDFSFFCRLFLSLVGLTISEEGGLEELLEFFLSVAISASSSLLQLFDESCLL